MKPNKLLGVWVLFSVKSSPGRGRGRLLCMVWWEWGYVLSVKVKAKEGKTEPEGHEGSAQLRAWLPFRTWWMKREHSYLGSRGEDGPKDRRDTDSMCGRGKGQTRGPHAGSICLMEPSGTRFLSGTAVYSSHSHLFSSTFCAAFPKRPLNTLGNMLLTIGGYS